jgi:threonine/homoserine efflux transporter RhtA
VPGVITATLGLGALVYAINRANQDDWTGGGVLGLGAVAAVLLMTFVLIQRRSATATAGNQPPGTALAVAALTLSPSPARHPVPAER